MGRVEMVKLLLTRKDIDVNTANISLFIIYDFYIYTLQKFIQNHCILLLTKDIQK